MNNKKVCKICEGRKHIKNKNGDWIACECLRGVLLENSYRDAFIPEQFFEWKWDDWKHQNIFQKSMINGLKSMASKMIKGLKIKKSIIITGPRDSGKSLLMSLLMMDCVRGNHTAFCAELGRIIDAQFSKEESEKIYLKKIYSRDLVCIEVGLEQEHKMSSIMIERIYNQRLSSGKQTFFTSRFPLTHIRVRYGDGMFDLFRNEKRFMVINL